MLRNTKIRKHNIAAELSLWGRILFISK